MATDLGADPAFVPAASSQQAVSTKGFNPGEGDWHERCFCGGEVIEGTEAWMHGFCRECWNEINGQFGVGA